MSVQRPSLDEAYCAPWNLNTDFPCVSPTLNQLSYPATQKETDGNKPENISDDILDIPVKQRTFPNIEVLLVY